MEVFVARQPIFDNTRRVFGYELLFRSGLSNAYAGDDHDRATLQVINTSYFELGFSELVGGKRAFINFTRDTLINEYAFLLPQATLVVEILETVEPDPDVLECCRELRRRGYTIALDDYVDADTKEELVALADIVKVDFLATPPAARAGLTERLRRPGIKLLAEKVETPADFEQGCQLGYSYFQGYFFSKPFVIEGRTIAANKMTYLRLLQAINDPRADFEMIEQLVKREVALSFKLLRYVNSVAFGLRYRVTSLKQALVLLGLQGIRKWASVVVLSDLAQDAPSELVVSSVQRARFCEALATRTGLGDRSQDLFLLGLFSLMDAILGRPLEEIQLELPLEDDCRQALRGEPNRLREVLDTAIAYEHGEWETVSRLARGLSLDEAELPAVFAESIRWCNSLEGLAA